MGMVEEGLSPNGSGIFFEKSFKKGLTNAGRRVIIVSTKGKRKEVKTMTRNEVLAILYNADEKTLQEYYNNPEFNRMVDEIAEEQGEPLI